MPKTSIKISLEPSLLEQVDRLVRVGSFRSRADFIRKAIASELLRFRRERFLAECAKLDPAEEQALSEEGMTELGGP